MNDNMNFPIPNSVLEPLMMDINLLKEMILNHIEEGKQMETQSNRFGFPVPKERLEGYIEGIRACLRMIDYLTKENE